MIRPIRRIQLLGGAALALTSAWAIAQDAPESLLPPGFEQPAQPRAQPKAAAPKAAAPKTAAPKAPAPKAPAPKAAAPKAAAPTPAPARNAAAAPAAPPAASDGGAVPAPAPALVLPPPAADASVARTRLPTLEELEKMSPEQLEEALGLKPKFDIPPAARRAMRQIGILDVNEGGMSATALVGQNASLVRAALAGNKGRMVSRWGHILLRRALASRLDAPATMNPADFAALRAGLLVRMGEGEAARALVQDVDSGNYTPSLLQSAFDAYVATADFTGLCPIMTIHGSARRDAEWEAARAICQAFRGDGSNALRQLDRAMSRETMPKIDVLLAQKYAGAAGKSRRAVTIEWDGVSDMTPWRYGLAIAVGLTPPANVMRNADARFDYIAATAPMVGLETRAAAADRAGAAGVLSSAAMVDLYSEIYASQDITGDWSNRAGQLRDAYVAAEPGDRLNAMQQLWSAAADPERRYARQVLTAYAAARLPVDAEFQEQSADLVASMLAAGLDQNALRWAGQADVGSLAWAMLTLAAPARSSQVGAGAVEQFVSDDDSGDKRKSAFLIAGLAGLGRVSESNAQSLASNAGFDLGRQTRWTRMIDQAAAVDNAALVALLAGVGMQGESWEKMTPLYLYHIVSALNAVGLDAEARMIAAEAVARG